MKDGKGVTDGYWTGTSHYTYKLLLRIGSHKESYLSIKSPLKGANERMLGTVVYHESEWGSQFIKLRLK